MAFRGTDVKEPLCANSLCWHIDWAQFNWYQQTARQVLDQYQLFQNFGSGEIQLKPLSN